LCPAIAIAYKGNTILAHWRRIRRLFAIFSLRMRRNGYLGAFSQKSDPAIRSGGPPRFPVRQTHCHYRVMFTGYIWCFCATTSRDLVTLTFDFFDLDIVYYSVPRMRDPHNNFSILRLSVTELWITEFRHISVTGYSHYELLCMRSVMWPITGGKNVPHFGNPWPKFISSLCHFQGTTPKIQPCNRRKIALITLWIRLQISLRMRSITWPVHSGPQKPDVTISWPWIVCTTFMGLRWRLRVPFYVSTHSYFSCFRQCPVKMAVFPKFKGLNIKCSQRDPQKGLPYLERRHLTYFASGV